MLLSGTLFSHFAITKKLNEHWTLHWIGEEGFDCVSRIPRKEFFNRSRQKNKAAVMDEESSALQQQQQQKNSETIHLFNDVLMQAGCSNNATFIYIVSYRSQFLTMRICN